MSTVYRPKQVVRPFHEFYLFVIQSSTLAHLYQGAVTNLRCYKRSHNGS